uniref:Serine threonine-protein phosphatase 6 regulatory ankyrin repeat subunit c-like n=1 Tax=Tetraselmis sp. GSL018 TaxID=582737 RepID=A0A061QVB2_9CHLO|eukprot:CAMPEP_0177615438 /NCGR_PEP_ID=MMETSP0419_2-20121207/23443_1 /TAXON_ID=582737 /ORGANISM="Tetraselmis sp., Strain GSL018" /LENGTH=570 /DNA_ID=CAMNT_0019113071 /DNA_START=85 /DNA_END=1797 /DNA_ORIENTATION=+
MEQDSQEVQQAKRRNDLLLVACHKGLYEDVEALISEGASLCHKDKKGLSGLHFATSAGHLSICRLLASKGADVDCEDAAGWTPLHFASAMGHSGIARWLASKGAWVDANNSADETPLHCAAKFAGPDTVRALLDAGAKASAADARGLTPAGHALMRGRADICKVLADAGALLDCRVAGYGLLHLLSGAGATASLRLLLGRGADPNEPSENGVMPLHCAASSGQLRAAEALLDHGADASVRDRDGSLPVDLVPAESSSAAAADLEALRRLLSKAARRSGARAAPSGGVPAAASQPEPFARLPREKQLRKVQAWSTWGEGRLRSEAGLNEEAVRCLKQVQRLRGALDVHAVVLELHTDEAFQADCRRPRVLRAVEAIMRDPAELKRFREDGAVMDVVLKLRRFQEAMRLQGNTQSISLRDIILRKASEAEETKRRHNILLYGYDQALDAAVAAASHESAEESRAAVTAIVGRQEAPGGSAPPGNSPAGDDQPEADSPSAGAEGSTQPPEGHPQAADAEERTGFWGTVLGQTLRTLIIAIISYVLAMMFQRNLNAHMTEAPVPRSPPFKHQEL